MVIGIDTGGTFTDFFWLDPNGQNALMVLKEPSTPHNPAQAIINGLKKIGKKFGTVVHGTTVATNALLERKGADVVLLTTAGFEDIIEIGRQTRSDIYDLNVERPEPLIPNDDRYGVSERLDKNGEILSVLQVDEDLIRTIIERSPDAIAICYLFSYANDTHEQKTKELLTDAGLQTYWSLSSEVLPEYREYERFSTTVVNAYVTPVMDGYLESLENNLDTDHLRIMQSNGGSMDAAAARRQAVQTLLSGPAGGVVAANNVARQCGLKNVISFDMGGTSTDVSFLPGRIDTTGTTEIDGLPVALPFINIHTVGAGGGSIASKDRANVLQVGPESAGAEPGPVCYDKGGTDLTVTDANLLTGRIVGSSVFGNSITLNYEQSAKQARDFASTFDISIEQLAESILEVVNAKMERAIRVISVEQGYDPGSATMIAFGGAGPLHGCAIAESLGIKEVLIPMHAGVFSALGLLWADVVRDRTQTMIRRTPDIDWEEVKQVMGTLEKQLHEDLEIQGIPEPEMVFEWSIDMRYRGQSYELTIPWQDNILEAFHQAHEQKYLFRHQERPLEIVNLHVRGIGKVQKPDLPKKELKDSEILAKRIHTQSGFYNGREIQIPVIPRDALEPGASGEGPFIITEETSTSFIPPDWLVRVDEFSHLRSRKGNK